MTMICIKKTIPWNEDSSALFNKCARLQKLGLPPMAEPCDFVGFIANVPLSCQDTNTFLAKVIKHAKLKDVDVTKVTTKAENKCLFSTRGNLYAAVEVIVSYLLTLNSNGKVPALWCYLDDEKKAIVHFVCHETYYAELYCLSSEASSALHLVTYRDNEYFIPVAFVPQFSDDLIANVESSGRHYLQEYLPRERFNCLSKGGKKAESAKTSDSKSFAQDRGDNL